MSLLIEINKMEFFMSATKSGVLSVPGASLTYDVRGSGPLLLMIAGGGGGGSVDWNDFVNNLTDAYTVITYDRRGAWRSKLDVPVESISLETHSDDAHRLLVELTTEPAYVFGSSAGALVGLDLVARHPEQIHTLIAHEPPAHYLFPASKTFSENPFEVYQREGGLAAMKWYGTQTGGDYEDREPGVKAPEEMNSERASADADAFFKYNVSAVRRYKIDFAALSAAPTRIILAGGSAGKKFIGYRAAAVVAERLHTNIVDCPGHHMGYMTHPQAFAKLLREVLADQSIDPPFQCHDR
jgi:pimeloyl-ACP methyl ester carboxylesterase